MPTKKDKDDKKSNSNVNTGGGAYIGGSVSTGGGDFLGRDRTVYSSKGGIAIGGNVSGSVIITGNGNTVNNNISSSDYLVKLLQKIQIFLDTSDLANDALDEIKSDLTKAQEQIIRPEPNGEIILKRLKSSLDYAEQIATDPLLIELLRRSVVFASQMNWRK